MTSRFALALVLAAGLVASIGADETHWLAVTDARTVGGDHPLLGKDVLNGLAPFTPRLYLAGPPGLARQFLEMPPGTAVRLEGLVNRGARTYVLRSVELRPAPDGQ